MERIPNGRYTKEFREEAHVEMMDRIDMGTNPMVCALVALADAVSKELK